VQRFPVITPALSVTAPGEIDGTRPGLAPRVSGMTIEPDTKDWTWVLQHPCPACGFRADAFERTELGRRTRATLPAWRTALTRPDVAIRPAPQVWSTLEYACHVRDVFRIFDERLRLMLTEDDPRFANWDQDETAVRERYGEQDPAVVGEQLSAAGETIAATFDAVPEQSWARKGLRSNGSEFTVETLGRYFLHDVVHHLNDIGAAVA
jgi:hypothetical protein